MTIISKSRFRQKYLFNEAADIAQFDLVNSMTFKDLWYETFKTFKSCFQVLSRPWI